MAYTASHWGSYRITDEGTLAPLDVDPNPSRIGRGWASAAMDPNSRIQAPCVRRGWLDGDNGANRNADSYVEVSWDRATTLVAAEIARIRDQHGNGAIFGGSYGWASAGRFHHAQSHLRRFLNLAGGYVAQRDTYSHAAAEVLWPHVLGLSNGAFQDQMTSLSLVAEHAETVLAIGGISQRTAQNTSAGTTEHELGGWLDRLRERGVRLINVSPRGTDLPGADWLSIRPGTDTAFLLALTHEVVRTGKANLDFLETRCSGWPDWRAYLLGDTDGQPKTPDWAAPICDIPADEIRRIAALLAETRSMISVAWSLQRADHGEQAIWAGLGLACALGQMGQPGTGYGFGYGSLGAVGRPARFIRWPSLPQGINRVADYIPVSRISDMLLCPGETYTYNGETRHYPDIRMVYWAGGNPFHHHQDLNRLEQAWQRPETVIVHDNAWTATARRADIALPATSPLERRDLMMSRSDPRLLYMSPMAKPMGAAKDDYAIFAQIAGHLGFEDKYTEGRDVDGWLRHLWSKAQGVAQREGFALPDYDTFAAVGLVDIPEARQTRIALGDFVADPDTAPLKTESGRITLHNAGIAAMDLADCPGHPTWIEPVENLLSAGAEELHLISAQPDTRLHSQNDRGSEARADKVAGREAAYLHPVAAAAHGVAEGDVIRLYNARGACLAGLRLEPTMRRDCIALATGAWFDPQEVAGERLEVHGNPNALTIDKGASGLSQANIAHTALVRVEKWDRPVPPLSVDRPPVIEKEATA